MYIYFDSAYRYILFSTKTSSLSLPFGNYFALFSAIIRFNDRVQRSIREMLDEYTLHTNESLQSACQRCLSYMFSCNDQKISFSSSTLVFDLLSQSRMLRCLYYEPMARYPHLLILLNMIIHTRF